MDVIATIWKNPYHTDRNQNMIDVGVNAFRVKCSHLPAEEISECLVKAREHINTSGKSVKLLADLPEAKIRLGEFPQGKIQVGANILFRFKFAKNSTDPVIFIPVKVGGLTDRIHVGDQFYSGDGQILWEVSEIEDKDTFLAKTMNAGTLVQRSALTFPKLADNLNHITPFIDEILAHLPKSKPDMVAFSFVNSRAMLETLISKLSTYTSDDWNPLVIAKIESKKGVENIDEILELTQGIMVARGDLGLNIPYAEVGVVQKRLVAKAKQQNKYVIVATQCLQSLLENNIPMRSDILDVTNSCLDGASAIMLCPETAHSETPERAVQVAKEIIAATRSRATRIDKE